MAYALWMRHLKFNPIDPTWFDRDRFILSAGHGCALLYSLLHLTGYDLPMEELKNFRQFGSMTPGHPENVLTPGVEMATGPLGQGFATSVGMAIAERFLAATFNKPGHEIVDHFTYVLASDGDLMEGITNEAASLAGHLELGRLIVLYDDNRITIDGPTSDSFSDDTEHKFEALGWHVATCDGMDVEQVDACISDAKSVTDRPSIIVCRTTIGFGSPNKAGTSKAHGSPLGKEELALTKEALGLPQESFYVPDDVLANFRQSLEKGRAAQREWETKFAAYQKAHPMEAKKLRSLLEGDLGKSWIEQMPTFDKDEATRVSSFQVLNAISGALPTLIGGSADLAESVRTTMEGEGDFQAGSYGGRNLHFGIREHAMMAAVNGITLHGATRGFGGTFLIFSDYCRPSLRLAALMEVPSIFLFSHDSIGLGEDGPTHQPIEQTMSLRLIPNFNLMRPADSNETAACWKAALGSTHTPCAILLSRQKLPLVSPSGVENHPAERGGYVLREASGGRPRLVLVATGSEVGLALEAQGLLEKQGIATRVVSLPSWFAFDHQPEQYRREVLPRGVPTVSVEAGTTIGWAKYAQAHVGLDRFGASAPGDVAMAELGFTADHVVEAARSIL